MSASVFARQQTPPFSPVGRTLEAGPLPRSSPMATPRAGQAVAGALDLRVHSLEMRLQARPADRALRLELARLLHDGHRYPEAIAQYQAALRMDPDDAGPYYDLASLYMETDAPGAGVTVLEQRLERAPSDARALYNIGAIRANQGRVGDAARWFRAAAESTTDVSLQARAAEALDRLEGS